MCVESVREGAGSCPGRHSGLFLLAAWGFAECMYVCVCVWGGGLQIIINTGCTNR